MIIVGGASTIRTLHLCFSEADLKIQLQPKPIVKLWMPCNEFCWTERNIWSLKTDCFWSYGRLLQWRQRATPKLVTYQMRISFDLSQDFQWYAKTGDRQHCMPNSEVPAYFVICPKTRFVTCLRQEVENKGMLIFSIQSSAPFIKWMLNVIQVPHNRPFYKYIHTRLAWHSLERCMNDTMPRESSWETWRAMCTQKLSITVTSHKKSTKHKWGIWSFAKQAVRLGFSS